MNTEQTSKNVFTYIKNVSIQKTQYLKSTIKAL